jgi:hypothetical protein
MDIIFQEPLDPPKIVSQKVVNEYKKSQQKIQLLHKSCSNQNNSASIQRTHSSLSSVFLNINTCLISLIIFICIIGALVDTTFSDRCSFILIVIVGGLLLWLKFIFRI